MMDIPLLQNAVKNAQEKFPTARAGVNETFVFPVLAPGIPSRNYFLFLQVLLCTTTQHTVIVKLLDGLL